MEKIGSVQENPFFTKFGLKQAPVSRSRFATDTHVSNQRRQSNGSVGEEEQPEYRPGSGFVHKLRDKWSHLNTREEVVLKKASSLEDLQPAAEDEAVKAKVISPRITNNVMPDKKQPNVMHPPKLAYRAQSIESLSQVQVHKKLHANNHRTGPHQHPQFAHHLRHVDPAWMKDKPSVHPLKSPRAPHVPAPDVDLARDDIIIIEKTPQAKTEDRPDNDTESESNSSSPPHSYREEILPDELPKPNTVQTVRNIFETNSSLPSKNSILQKRRLSGTPPTSLSLSTAAGTVGTSHVSSPGSSENSVSIRGFSPVTSPRLFSPDNLSKSVLSPPANFVPGLSWNQANHSKPTATDLTSSSSSYSSYSHSSRLGNGIGSGSSKNRDKTSQSSAATDSTNLVSSSSSASSSTNIETKQTSVLERSNFFESPRWGETRTSSSPRNTASVKPTVSSKPSSPVKPLPLSTPASAATSYKRSSPVVPVAPYKDNKDDSKDDDSPVMIFSKSKISPNKEKTPRINDYSPVNEPPKGLPDDKLKKNKGDVIINNDFKTRLHNRDAKIDLKGDNKLASQKNTEKKSPQVETDKIIQTPHQTTIQIGSSRKTGEIKNDKSNSIDKTTSQPSALPVKRTQAPGVPAAEKVKSQMAPQPPDIKDGQPQSMLYVSSSESGESDSSTPPETPRTRDDSRIQKSQDDVKGVPSLITVSRLEQDSGPAPPRFSSAPEKNGGGISSAVPSAPSVSVKTKTAIKPQTSSDTAASANRSTSFPSLYQSKASEKEPVSKDNTSSISKAVSSTAESSQDKPIKGIPSIIANRMKADPSQVARNVVSNNSSNNFLKLDSNLNDESSTDSDASPRPLTNKPVNSSSSASSPFAVNLTSVSSTSDPGKEAISSEITNEIESVRRKMESAKKQSSVAEIFSSSQLAEKRKKIQQQKAAAQAAQGIVPKLDLSGIDVDRSKIYSPPQKTIKPCNIRFIGENAKTSRSLLTKKRVKKVSRRIIVEFLCQCDVISLVLSLFCSLSQDCLSPKAVFLSLCVWPSHCILLRVLSCIQIMSVSHLHNVSALFHVLSLSSVWLLSHITCLASNFLYFLSCLVSVFKLPIVSDHLSCPNFAYFFPCLVFVFRLST